MQELVYINGKYYTPQEAKISIYDYGVMAGDVVTESTRTFNHKPYRFDQHLERLYKSLKISRYNIRQTLPEMKKMTLEVIEKNRQCYKKGEDFWIVHNITRGTYNLAGDPTKNEITPTIIIQTTFMDLKYWAKFYLLGCHAVTPFSRLAPPQALDPKIKNKSRMNYTLCELEVKLIDPEAQGIILDIYGNLAENKGGNFFIISKGAVYTPTTRNALAGESRQTILELCKKLRIPCYEQDLQPYHVYTAEEAFFTSTPYCIMPATKFNGLPVGSGKVGPITKKLLTAWSKMVGVDIVKQAINQLDASTRNKLLSQV